MNYLLAIVGPTATGKSALAMDIAERYGGEIINADSRQIYRYMDIGTAKPDISDRRKLPHHLYDIIDPDENYSLAIYQKSVNDMVTDIFQRGKMPVLVGGTGLYIWAVLEGWEIPSILPDPEYRKSLEQRAEKEGWQPLFAELQNIDPVAAEKIMPTNVRRVIRALEISKFAGVPASQLRKKKGAAFNFTVIGLTAERKELYKRIDDRVDNMIASGLLKEVKNLIDKGYNIDLPSMSGIGYKQIAIYLSGEMGLEDAVIKIKNETHRLARKQYAWFRLTDTRIHWFDVNGNIKDNIYTLIDSEIKKGSR